MNILLRKPYLLSWLLIPVLLLAGFLFRQHTLDVQLYDTYYLVGSPQFVTAGSLLLFITGLGYWLMSRTSRSPNDKLSALHLILTVGALLALATLFFDENGLTPIYWLLGWLAVLLAGQLVYAINVLASLLRK